jgi:4-deoxy-L-threo-5-hexosulose-uronate ketol-isomerase
VPENQLVVHYLGEPTETRHIMVENHGAVLSPPWSIHAGCGTSNYGFIWGMAGENLEYGDMDALKLSDLR